MKRRPEYPDDFEIYQPEMSFREYWHWSKDHDPTWRRGMIWGMTSATVIVAIFVAILAS